MARVIVWAKPDNDNPDSVVNARKFKRGMVVDVLEDGQHAGNDVEKGDWWRIVEVPGEPASSFLHLLQSDPKFKDPKLFVSEAQFPRKRVTTLDLDAIEAGAGKLDPDQSVTLAKSAIDAQAKPMTKLDNPNVIAPVEVIG